MAAIFSTWKILKISSTIILTIKIRPNHAKLLTLPRPNIRGLRYSWSKKQGILSCRLNQGKLYHCWKKSKRSIRPTGMFIFSKDPSTASLKSLKTLYVNTIKRSCTRLISRKFIPISPMNTRMASKVTASPGR